jgi:gamma-glutamylputrescine oxidase
MSIYSLKKDSGVKLSYWELKQYFACFDLIVVGSGIVGLNSAIAYKKKRPGSKVLVLEMGILPSGASTKNAGFACFGSPSELLSDLKKMPEKLVWDTVKMRIAGLKLLRKNLGEKAIRYKNWGGYELFRDKTSFEKCAVKLNYLNRSIETTVGKKKTYCIETKAAEKFGFKGIKGVIVNRHEAQLDTSLMMENLVKLAHKHDVKILNSIEVREVKDVSSHVELKTEMGVFKGKKVIVAINGFAKKLLKLKQVEPARAQVLITRPIEGLKLKGTFHYEEGFYYFRNIDGRVLFGGGRNLDLKGETTFDIAVTKTIQSQLEHLLKTVILPDQKFEIEHRWAGIMGVGSEKKPIIKHYTDNIVCAVRMGGMGVAIGSIVGEKASELVLK